MHGAKKEIVEAFVEGKEAAGEMLFVLDYGDDALLCVVGRNDTVMHEGVEDEALYTGLMKHLRRIGRIYSDETAALAAAREMRSVRRG